MGAETKTTSPALNPLDQKYKIVGELRGSRGQAFKTYIARRRAGGADVIITVASAAPDDNNALSHVASDTQLLKGLRHPHLARVVDGLWLGTDAFAAVSERVRGTTLAELLDRGERIATPRIATILLNVSAVLDWAREQGIVHRGVTPATLTIDGDANQACVSLVPSPLPIGGVPDACTDARTIGLLARDMLAGRALDAATDDDAIHSLAEARPDLAVRIIDETERIAACKQNGTTPDIRAYLAVVASADVIKQSEVEMAALQVEYGDQHRRELEKCDAQRAELERRAADQAAELAGEREEFERAMAAERAKADDERARLDAAMAERQQRLTEIRAELEQQRELLASRLEEFDAKRVELEHVRDQAIAAGATVAPIPKAARNVVRVNRDLPRILSPVVAKPAPANRHGWIIPLGVVFTVAILVAAAIIINHRNDSRTRAAFAARHAVDGLADSGGLPRGGFLTQSAAGSLARPFNGSPVASPSGGLPDSIFVRSGVMSDSVRAAQDSAAARGARRDAALIAARRADAERARRAAIADTVVRLDSVNQGDSNAIRDTTMRRDSINRPDSARRDSTFGRDTMFKRDSLIKRDTTRPRPDTLPPARR